MPDKNAPAMNRAKDPRDRASAQTAPPSAPPNVPSTNPARRPNRAMKADIGAAVSMDPITISDMGSVARQAFGASCLPASPAMVKISGICAPRMACAATRTRTLRRASVSVFSVMVQG